MAEGDSKVGEQDPWGGNIISLSTSDDPTPTLYHYIESYFSQIVRLVLAEEGVQYNSRILDVQRKSEQLESWFIAANQNAAVPVLVYRGQPYVESKDISMFIVQQISDQHTLLGDANMQDKVKSMFNRHFEECPIERATMSAIVMNSYIFAFLLPKKINANISSLKKMKEERPEIADIIDNKIAVYTERLTLYENPEPKREAAVAEMQGFLDELENNLSESEFTCGSKYTLVDCVATCLLARLNMISLLDAQLQNRPKLTEYWQRVQKRPSYKMAAIFSEPMTVGTVAQKFCSIL